MKTRFFAKADVVWKKLPDVTYDDGWILITEVSQFVQPTGKIMYNNKRFEIEDTILKLSAEGTESEIYEIYLRIKNEDF